MLTREGPCQYSRRHVYDQHVITGMHWRDTTVDDLDNCYPMKGPSCDSDSPWRREIDQYAQLKRVLVDKDGVVFRAPDSAIESAIQDLSGADGTGIYLPDDG